MPPAKHTAEGKECGRCKQFKSLDQFHKRAGRASSYHPFCKPCCREHRNAYKYERYHSDPQFRLLQLQRCKMRKKERYNSDPMFRLVKLQRNRMTHALRRARAGKQGSKSLELLGCTGEFLYNHLKQQLPDGANWSDYHVDHIRPIASFDLNDPQQMQECFNWRNLQLLTASENMAKGSKW